MKKGYSPFRADRNHVHHLMLGLGLKHRQVTFILMGISIGFIIIAILGRNLSNGILALVVLSLCVVLTEILWNLVNKNNATKLKK